jgi:hypothetical protein
MDQSPCGGQLEVWAGSYDVNFHCDYLKLFLKVQECTSFLGIKKNSSDFPQKNYSTISVFFKSSRELQVHQKSFQKNINFFSYGIDPKLHGKF